MSGLRQAMAKTIGRAEIGTIEKALLKVDDGVVGAVYRAAIGFAALPAMSFLLGDDVSDWTLIPFLLAILLLLRAVPAVVRELVPFGDEVLRIWAERRRTAKRYDSYQWRKLLWIGVGLTLNMVASGRLSTALMVVSSICLVGGAAGTAMWYLLQASGQGAGLSAQKSQRVA